MLHLPIELIAEIIQYLTDIHDILSLSSTSIELRHHCLTYARCSFNVAYFNQNFLMNPKTYPTLSVIREINFYTIEHKFKSWIKFLPNLRSIIGPYLDLDNCPKRIKKLHCRKCWVTHPTIQELSMGIVPALDNFSSLKFLSLNTVGLTQENLNQMSQLKYLYYNVSSHNLILPDLIKYIGPVCNLPLSIESVSFTITESMIDISNLTNLRKLELVIRPHAQLFQLHNNSITSLNLIYDKIVKHDINLPNLRILKLKNNSLMIDEFPNLMKNIKSLDLLVIKYYSLLDKPLNIDVDVKEFVNKGPSSFIIGKKYDGKCKTFGLVELEHLIFRHIELSYFMYDLILTNLHTFEYTHTDYIDIVFMCPNLRYLLAPNAKKILIRGINHKLDTVQLLVGNNLKCEKFIAKTVVTGEFSCDLLDVSNVDTIVFNFSGVSKVHLHYLDNSRYFANKAFLNDLYPNIDVY